MIKIALYLERVYEYELKNNSIQFGIRFFSLLGSLKSIW